MSLLNDKVINDLKNLFAGLKKDVNILFFTQELECAFCRETHALVEEVTALNDKLHLNVFDLVKDHQEAEKYQIDKIPALVVMDEKDRGIRFFGVPAGYEFSSFISSVLLVSTGNLTLKKSTREVLDYIKKPIDLKVFVTPTCPYCPAAVILAHQMAYYSENITASMIESSEFQPLAIKYQVQGVPRTIINETVFMEGAAPEEMLLEKIKASL